MTTPDPQYPTCPTCGHAARHTDTNVRRCDECGGPCVTEEGWRTFGISRPWPGRREVMGNAPRRCTVRWDILVDHRCRLTAGHAGDHRCADCNANHNALT